MRGFEPRRRAKRGERTKAEVAGMAIEWEDGAARMGGVALIQIEGPLSRCAGWWSMGYDEILEAHDEACRSDARAGLQVMHSPGGYLSGLNETAKEIEAMWPASDEPRWEDQPPSEVASLIYSRTRHYFSTSQDAHRLGARWVHENAVELDRLWARQEVAKRAKQIEKLQSEIASLRRDYIDIDEEEDEAA